MIKNVYGFFSCKVPLFLLDFKETCICWTDFLKIVKYQISRKFVHWEPNCSMRAYGWTDKTMLIVVSEIFQKRLKSEASVIVHSWTNMQLEDVSYM